MELIPILSTIILVATISTFLLAIGAYILYKVREAKGQQVSAPSPSAVKAELITPIEGSAPFTFEQPKTGPQPVYIEQPVSLQYQPSAQPLYAQQPQYAPMPKQYAEPIFADARNFPSPAPKRAEPKFMKYTEEGYIPAKSKEEKNNGALRWK